ncbi:uncharacterized protein TRUGW13939_01918 [Talaromyces rugulosus]|uniref:Uncharacterized protein n=1 Tax=Talaromyces rugulosus TaxID=121627 RepID=A0A7H8QLL8_TALRU|nr:uncharacterized protein TRUGW13939_01918 [Talaromyces rugulosus]QKX54829.1 hypothetical protein TRUGW13939_01918 [Talaromyces rugulosus]
MLAITKRGVFLLLSSLTLLHLTLAAASPSDIANAVNSLASETFSLKDYVSSVATSSNSGGIQSIYDQLDDIHDHTLSDIGFTSGTPVIQDTNDQQVVYESYSNWVQSLFELTDNLTGNAAALISLDQEVSTRMPFEIRIFSGVVDAYLFNLIGLWPTTTAYVAQASNQKNQVDDHFQKALNAYPATGSGNFN